MTGLPGDIRHTDITGSGGFDGFEEIVAGLAEEQTCEHTDECSNRVNWFIKFHHCGDYMMCDSHTQSWVQEAADALIREGVVGCFSCGRYFRLMSDLCDVMPV